MLGRHTPDRLALPYPPHHRRRLRHGWPTLTDQAEPDPAPHTHEAFAQAVPAIHDILPAAGGQPAICRTCHTPPDQCPVWALAQGFLGITPTTDQPAAVAAR